MSVNLHRRMEAAERKSGIGSGIGTGLHDWSDSAFFGMLAAWRKIWRGAEVEQAERALLERFLLAVDGEASPAEALRAPGDAATAEAIDAFFAEMDKEDADREAFNARPDIAAAIAANRAVELVCDCPRQWRAHLTMPSCEGKTRIHDRSV